MKPYLIQEAGSPYIWITHGVGYTYLRTRGAAEALGIPWEITVVPRGTLLSLARLDKLGGGPHSHQTAGPVRVS